MHSLWVAGGGKGMEDKTRRKEEEKEEQSRVLYFVCLYNYDDCMTFFLLFYSFSGSILFLFSSWRVGLFICLVGFHAGNSLKRARTRKKERGGKLQIAK